MTPLLPILGRLLSGSVGLLFLIIAVWEGPRDVWQSLCWRAYGEAVIALALTAGCVAIGAFLLVLAILG